MTNNDRNNDDWSDGASTGSRELREVLEAIWAWVCVEFPERAISAGEKTSSLWTDLGSVAHGQRANDVERFNLQIRQIASGIGLSESDSIDAQIAEHQLSSWYKLWQFPSNLLPIDQLDGLHQRVSLSLRDQTLDSPDDLAFYLARLQDLPRLFEQCRAVLTEGLDAGITPASVSVQHVPEQLRVFVRDSPFGPLLAPLVKRGRIADSALNAAREIVSREIEPAITGFADWFASDYVPNCRTGVSLSELDSGESWYVALAEYATTTGINVQDLHKVGVEEVERIVDEMDSLEHSMYVEHGTTAREYLNDPSWFATSADEALMWVRSIVKTIDPMLLEVVNQVPSLPYGVEQMPAELAVNAPCAYYIPGSALGRRPGTFMVNTIELNRIPKWRLMALALHESVPGHHLQHAISEETKGLPQIRRQGDWTAYIEGWGLYAEYLGEELGCYRQPSDVYGRLQMECWRAARLVVDTGIHVEGWNREKAIKYVGEVTRFPMTEVIPEVDRYITWPGQALAYKYGEMAIRRLRTKWEDETIGAQGRRSFHDEFLRFGPAPMSIVDSALVPAARRGEF